MLVAKKVVWSVVWMVAGWVVKLAAHLADCLAVWMVEQKVV